MSTFESGPSDSALADLRQLSPFPGDGGELIGKHPDEVPLRDSLPLPRGEKSAEGPSGAMSRLLLRSAEEVRKCTAVACPSWPFRMGTNPFREKRVLSPEQKREMVDRLARARESASAEAACKYFEEDA